MIWWFGKEQERGAMEKFGVVIRCDAWISLTVRI